MRRKQARKLSENPLIEALSKFTFPCLHSLFGGVCVGGGNGWKKALSLGESRVPWRTSIVVETEGPHKKKCRVRLER